MSLPEDAPAAIDAQLAEVDREIGELRLSINSTRTHGLLYYLVLVAIMLVGFTAGYATHSLIGAAIIIAGLAVVAWREVNSYGSRRRVLNQLLGEKMARRRQLEDRKREFEIERSPK